MKLNLKTIGGKSVAYYNKHIPDKWASSVFGVKPAFGQQRQHECMVFSNNAKIINQTLNNFAFVY